MDIIDGDFYDYVYSVRFANEHDAIFNRRPRETGQLFARPEGQKSYFFRCTEVSYRELISTAVLIASAGMEHDRAAALFVFKGADLLMVHMRMQRALWTREM